MDPFSGTLPALGWSALSLALDAIAVGGYTGTTVFVAKAGTGGTGGAGSNGEATSGGATGAGSSGEGGMLDAPFIAWLTNPTMSPACCLTSRGHGLQQATSCATLVGMLSHRENNEWLGCTK